VASFNSALVAFPPSPLVLKSDNGSGFISAAMHAFLDRHQVQPLFSPPWTPEYNGACEAGNGALQTYTHHQAARQGRTGHWTAGDLEAGRRMANELVYPDGPTGPTRRERFDSAPSLTLEDRAAFGRTVQREQAAERLKQGYPPDTDLGHAAQAQIDRVAIGCALVEHGYLSFTQRSITPSLKSQNLPKIP
jgi:transposase InsO family protein